MTSSLLKQVHTYLRSHTRLRPHDRVLAGVSGGPDSTALLHLLHRLAPSWSFRLGVVHFDHGLRPASGDDARWVAELAASLDLPCTCGAADVRAYQKSHKISLQTAARELRLNFLQEIRQQHGYGFLALGHTADDQVELFFLRLLRGAGPEGVKGMWPQTAAGIIRPLLGTSKARLVAWLESEGLPWRLDDSNLSRRYRRNQLRLDLVPQLETCNPRFSEAILRFQALLQEQEEYVQAETSRVLAEMLPSPPQGSTRLPLPAFLALHPALQKRVFRAVCGQAGVPVERLTHRHMSAAINLCRNSQPTGEISLPGSWRLLKENQYILWQAGRPTAPPASEPLIFGAEGTCTFLGWTLSWSTHNVSAGEKNTSPSSMSASLDHEKLRFPLRLRTFRPGDRFQPLGLAGTKKLHDFFIDAKIPRSRRPFIPLLESGGEIVWIAGRRLAESVKITPQTTRIFKIAAIPPSAEISSPAGE